MKAIQIIFTVLILGIGTAQAQQTFSFQTNEDYWMYDKNHTTYWTSLCYPISDKQLETVQVFFEDKALPFTKGGIVYGYSFNGNSVIVSIKRKDNTVPPNPGKKIFLVTIISK